MTFFLSKSCFFWTEKWCAKLVFLTCGFKVIQKGKLDSEAFLYTFKDNIYKFLRWDTIRPLCRAAVFEGKKLSGSLFFFHQTYFEPSYDIDENSLEAAKQYWASLLVLKGELFFKVEGFGEIIWFIRNNQIFVYRPSFPDLYEANEFIHKFYTEEAIRSIAKFDNINNN